MATSVSRINVMVGANTSQLTVGMNHASATVKRGFGGVQSIAQQATFAVDDFFAAFATGGVAGGIRGATNNLTMIAASIGGIKTQLAVIAGLAIAQLFAKQWDKAADATSGATDELRDYGNELKRVSGLIARNQTLRQSMREIGGIDKVSDAFRQQNEGRTSLADLQAQLGENDQRILELSKKVSTSRDALLVNSRLATDFDNAAARLVAPEVFQEIDAARERQKLVKEELAARKDMRQSLLDEITDQQKLNAETERRVKVLNSRLPFPGGAANRAGGMLGLDAQLAELRAKLLPSMSVAEMFTRFPGANQMGSGGAVSAINAAQFGPQNMQNSGLALDRERNRLLAEIARLERQKQGLEVVPIQ